MARVSLTIEDYVPGEVVVSLSARPDLPADPALLTAAQRVASAVFAPYIDALARRPGGVAVSVRRGDAPPAPLPPPEPPCPPPA